MVTIMLKGYITEDGKLEVDLPENHPVGEVAITIQAEHKNQQDFEPGTLGEVLASGLIGAWKDMEITDSVEWVEQVRKKEREQRGW